MPLTYPRRYSTTGSTYLSPASGSSFRLSTYSSSISSSDRDSYKKSDTATSSYYNSRSSYKSPLNRTSLADSTASSRFVSKYSVRSSSDKDLPPSGASSSSSASRFSRSDSRSRDYQSASSLARQATSGYDLYEKYSPSNYTPKCELSRSRSLSETNKLTKDRTTPTRDSTTPGKSSVIGGDSGSTASSLGKVKKLCAPNDNFLSTSSSSTHTPLNNNNNNRLSLNLINNNHQSSITTNTVITKNQAFGLNTKPPPLTLNKNLTSRQLNTNLTFGGGGKTTTATSTAALSQLSSKIASASSQNSNANATTLFIDSNKLKTTPLDVGTTMTTNNNYNNNITTSSELHHRIGGATAATKTNLITMKATNDFNSFSSLGKGGGGGGGSPAGDFFAYKNDHFKKEYDMARNAFIKSKFSPEINNNSTAATNGIHNKFGNNNLNGIQTKVRVKPLVHEKISQLMQKQNLPFACEHFNGEKKPAPTLAELKSAAIQKAPAKIIIPTTVSDLNYIDSDDKHLSPIVTTIPITIEPKSTNDVKLLNGPTLSKLNGSSPISSLAQPAESNTDTKEVKIINHKIHVEDDDVKTPVMNNHHDDSIKVRNIMDDDGDIELDDNTPVATTNGLSATSTAPSITMTSGGAKIDNLDHPSDSIRNASLRTALPPTPTSSSKYWDRERPTSLASRALSDTNNFALSKSAFSSSSSLNDAYDKTASSTETAEGLCGLRNIGNTCFMNSVLQCLSHTNELSKFLKKQYAPQTTTKDQRIFAEFVKLIKDMWTANTKSVTPSELKSAISSKYRMYSGSAQQDAQEFLRFFLDTLHSALNTGTKGVELKIDDSMSDSRKADLTWEWHSKVENSLVRDLFVGQLKSSLKCTVCGNTSVTFDPFWDLSVPLPSATRCKLENCLELFIKEDVLDGDEMPTCSKCETRRKCTKSFTIQRFPKYLVIHLKRFSETRWSKLMNIVEFPTGERELDMSPYASPTSSSSATYTLYGISNHMGSTAGGHYVAVCKHPLTRKWHEFNDNYVSESSESNLISSSAYLLFYERS